jgi:hypothetical protein
MKRKLYDSFIYNGEDNMLNFRLNEFDEVVEKFIVVECNHTFKGDKKEFYFPDSNIKNDKIIYVPMVDFIPDLTNPWENEKATRNYAINGFKGIDLYPDDIIVNSDLDEISDIRDLHTLVDNGISKTHVCLHDTYMYNFNCWVENKTAGARITNVNLLKNKYNLSFHDLRWDFDVERIGDGLWNAGGWHLCFFGDVDFMIRKLESYSHQEFNTSDIKNREKIERLVKEGKDILNRTGSAGNIQIKEITENSYLPRKANLLMK